MARRREGTTWRATNDGLSLVLQVVRFGRKVLFKRQWHGLGGTRQQSGTATRGDGHTKNAPQRAATIDCIHWLSPFGFGYLFLLFSSPK
jgi:hypothetical protein